jgi:hypothetical protein
MFIKSSHLRPDTLILRCFSEDNTFLETLARNGQRVAFLGAASASAPLIRETRFAASFIIPPAPRVDQKSDNVLPSLPRAIGASFAPASTGWLRCVAYLLRILRPGRVDQRSDKLPCNRRWSLRFSHLRPRLLAHSEPETAPYLFIVMEKPWRSREVISFFVNPRWSWDLSSVRPHSSSLSEPDAAPYLRPPY